MLDRYYLDQIIILDFVVKFIISSAFKFTQNLRNLKEMNLANLRLGNSRDNSLLAMCPINYGRLVSYKGIK